MTREELYRIWAPEASVWSVWAKPVIFAQITPEPEEGVGADWKTIAGDWSPPVPGRVAIVVDLPGRESVLMGLALAERGYRPVPLYNACRGPSAVVNVDDIASILARSAPNLLGMGLSVDAPPAFLLDANRLSGGLFASPGQFDNRWIVFPQDFPSGVFLMSRGIQAVLLIHRFGGSPKHDLVHVLRRWQEAGLCVLVNDPYDGQPARELQIPLPSRFGSIWYRAMAMVGLRRNSAGGFGAVVPEPTQSSGFG